MNNTANIIENKNISIDISIVCEVSGNDESFIKTMVQTFLKTMSETIRKIEKSLSEQDWENVYKCAHFAKSSLSIIKVGEMLKLVLQAEASAKNKTDLDTIPGAVKKLKEKYAFAEELLLEKFSVRD